MLFVLLSASLYDVLVVDRSVHTVVGHYRLNIVFRPFDDHGTEPSLHLQVLVYRRLIALVESLCMCVRCRPARVFRRPSAFFVRRVQIMAVVTVTSPILIPFAMCTAEVSCAKTGVVKVTSNIPMPIFTIGFIIFPFQLNVIGEILTCRGDSAHTQKPISLCFAYPANHSVLYWRRE